MQFKNIALLTTFIPLISANPAAHPGLPLPLSSPSISLPLGVPATVTSVINSVATAAGTPGLPIIGSLSSVPGVTVPTGLPTSPITGLPTDPATLANDIAEVITILQLILGLLKALGVGDSDPNSDPSELVPQVTLINALLLLASNVIP